MLINERARAKNIGIFQFFVASGYKRDRVLSEMRKVLSLTQDESLRAREKHTTSRVPLVTTYNPRTSYIAEVANRN